MLPLRLCAAVLKLVCSFYRMWKSLGWLTIAAALLLTTLSPVFLSRADCLLLEAGRVVLYAVAVLGADELNAVSAILEEALCLTEFTFLDLKAILEFFSPAWVGPLLGFCPVLFSLLLDSAE